MTALLAEDTIAALATPPGRGALAIVRLSGPEAVTIAGRVLDPMPAVVREATLTRAFDSARQLLDQVVATVYRAPASFTGEDTVEVTCHGGAVAPASVLAAFVAAGARPALPGEFTRRAVLHGKLDLLQAEAIGDLIDAGTRAAQRAALAQLDGGMSRRIEELRRSIVELEALCAYDIDFPEEDDGPIPPARILGRTEQLIAVIDGLLATAPMGEIVRHGAVVVIAGAPNVGKSSLFNALLGRRRAIVTDVPGTTRDALEATTEAEGWPIRLVDTAGLRDAADLVERVGIEVSREYIGTADVILACGDSASAMQAARDALTDASAPVVSVRTKADLLPLADRADDGALQVSAETGEGIVQLLGAIANCLADRKGPLSLDAPLVTRERQRSRLARARDELHAFRTAWMKGEIPPVVAAVHLRSATRDLEEIVGVVDVEDVLDQLFSSFCVGK